MAIFHLFSRCTLVFEFSCFSFLFSEKSQSLKNMKKEDFKKKKPFKNELHWFLFILEIVHKKFSLELLERLFSKRFSQSLLQNIQSLKLSPLENFSFENAIKLIGCLYLQICHMKLKTITLVFYSLKNLRV